MSDLIKIIFYLIKRIFDLFRRDKNSSNYEILRSILSEIPKNKHFNIFCYILIHRE
jgi:hypothetical protein